MGKMADMISKARKYVGYDYNHFCAQFGGGCFAWCAAFISTIGKESRNGDIIPWSTSCNEQIRQFKAAGAWLGKTTDIQVGDIVYYDWDFKDEPLPADHVGVVCEVNGSNIRVIEGNMGNADNCDTTVGYRTITPQYKYIFGIARPAYTGQTATTKEQVYVNVELRQLEKGYTGRDVEALQAILIAKGISCGTYGSDGEFGDCTDKAVRNFQTERKIEVDGIVGPQTWKELFK